MQRWPARLSTEAGIWTVRPAAFILVGHDPALWLIFDRASCDRHGASTLFTLCMMLVIQRSEHRDTQARASQPQSIAFAAKLTIERYEKQYSQPL